MVLRNRPTLGPNNGSLLDIETLIEHERIMVSSTPTDPHTYNPGERYPLVNTRLPCPASVQEYEAGLAGGREDQDRVPTKAFMRIE
jgi:hypothetical protein